MKDSVESRLGLFFAFAIIALLFILEFAGGLDFFKAHRELHARFKNVQGLKDGDFVKMAGVPVGRVKTIELTNGFADVTMKLTNWSNVKVDSKATIQFTGLMAQNFVSISFGVDSHVADDGQRLDVDEQPDLSELMNKVDKVATGVENLTRSFSGEKIDNIFGPITDLIKNNQTNLTATIANIRAVTQRIRDGTNSTIGELINTNTLYLTALNTVSNLENTGTNIQDLANRARQLVTNVNDAVTYIKSGGGTIGKLYKDDTLYMETTGSMTNLHLILLKINNGQGTIGQLINDDSMLKNAKVSLQKIDKATESLEDTGPLSVLGTMVSTLF